MESMAEGQEGKRESLAEGKRQAAFAEVMEALATRLPHELKQRFEANGKEYELTSAEDCMVAFAQQLRSEVAKLHDEIIAKDDYYEEKASAKLLELFRAHERLVALYAELRSYYPVAGERASSYLPSLSECLRHGEELYRNLEK